MNQQQDCKYSAPSKTELAQQYDELATLWLELAEDLADEAWLAVENEVLVQFEKALDD